MTTLPSDLTVAGATLLDDVPTLAARPAPPPPDPERAAAPREWSTSFGAPNVDARPNAIAVSGRTAYLGGSFAGTMAGMPTGTYNRVVRWDGTAWQRMGEGVDSTVHALALDGRDVYVGGEFQVAGGTVAANGLARWDGRRWSGVAGGVRMGTVPALTAVRALACDGTRLYVAGVFDTVGSGPGAMPANGFAALTLATGEWETFDGGLWFQDGPGEGRALLLAAGRLYVGGSFDRAGTLPTGSVAALELATGRWTTFGDGVRNGDFIGSVDSLAADERTGTVYVGGSFTAAGPVTTSGVATLSGDRFGTLGAFTRFGDASTARVAALAVSDGKLYAGGTFTAAGDAAASSWAVHDPAEGWRRPGDGVDNEVVALAAYGKGVIVAGDFAFSGDLRMTHAGIWTGAGWQTFGQGPSYDPYADANVFAVAAGERVVYAGGYFDQAGAVPVGSVAEWNGRAWRRMGGGVRGANGLGTIYGMARMGGDLYVTGTFAAAGDGAAANIARWDGRRWSALGSGINGTGYALAVLGGRLYVGGSFSAAGQTAANGVAAWDPATGTWSALGNAPAYDHKVYGLAVIADRYLIIGGEFDALRRGGRDLVRGLNGMVAFDTQAEIAPDQPLAGYRPIPGVKRASGTGMVRALQVLGNDLYVGGTFDTAGVLTVADPRQDGIAAQNLAVWHVGGDGTWSVPGGADEPVMALTTLDGRSLVVGGWFRSIGPIAAGGVAELDPETGAWTAYGEGIGEGQRGVRRVEALAQSAADGLWVGGTFNTAGGRPSNSFALWRGTKGRTA